MYTATNSKILLFSILFFWSPPTLFSTRYKELVTSYPALLLQEAGSELGGTDAVPTNLYFFGVKEFRNAMRRTAVHYAASQGHTSIIETVLIAVENYVMVGVLYLLCSSLCFCFFFSNPFYFIKNGVVLFFVLFVLFVWFSLLLCSKLKRFG